MDEINEILNLVSITPNNPVDKNDTNAIDLTDLGLYKCYRQLKNQLRIEKLND